MNKVELSEAQKSILEKIITKKDSSTFILLINDEQEADLKSSNFILEESKKLNKTDEVLKGIKDAKEKIYSVYKDVLTCVHCGKTATLTASEDNDIKSFTCDCEEAKKELSSKEAIIAQEEVLKKEFYNLQISSTNKGIELYKKNYEKFIAARDEAFKKWDSDIMSVSSL